MELLRRNIHMDGREKDEKIRITLEDDMNLPETKPDVGMLCMERGIVVTEEIRPMAGAVSVKGRLVFSVLYHTQEDGGRLACVEGKIPFEETIRMDNASPEDSISVIGKVEDLTIGMINSRKLSVQALILLCAEAEELYDEAVTIGIAGEESENGDVQFRRIPVEAAQIAMSRKDVLRVREEMQLPSACPNIGSILWKSAEPGEMNFRLGEEKLSLQGEIVVFILYEPEGNGSPQIYETTVNIGTEFAAAGCRDKMVPDVRYEVAQCEFAVRPDEDGEPRCLGLEMSVELRICVYEQLTVDLITDIYGVTREISGIRKEAGLMRLLRSVTGRAKVAEHVAAEAGEHIASLVRSEGIAFPEEAEVRANGILLRGYLGIRILYVTGEEERPYGRLRTDIPFEYFLEIPGMSEEMKPGRIQTVLEQLTVTMLDEEELDIKAILSFSTTALCPFRAEMIGEVTEEALDENKMRSLPGMVIYVVKQGDNLWNIGKRYYVPVQRLLQFNHLEGQEITPGQKLLIVKGA